jgi:hypothetical protein
MEEEVDREEGRVGGQEEEDDPRDEAAQPVPVAVSAAGHHLRRAAGVAAAGEDPSPPVSPQIGGFAAWGSRSISTSQDSVHPRRGKWKPVWVVGQIGRLGTGVVVLWTAVMRSSLYPCPFISLPSEQGVTDLTDAAAGDRGGAGCS